MDRPVGLNWGCGSAIHLDWYNVDPNPILAPVADARDTDKYPDGTFDGIVANHSLQCIDGALLNACVREFHRLLRPGGRLRVLVPNVLAAFHAYAMGNASWSGFDAISEPWDLDRKFAHYLTWGGQNRSCFTSASLAEVLFEGGFHAKVREGEPWPWLCELDTRRDESIIMEVAK